MTEGKFSSEGNQMHDCIIFYASLSWIFSLLFANIKYSNLDCVKYGTLCVNQMYLFIQCRPFSLQHNISISIHSTSARVLFKGWYSFPWATEIYTRCKIFFFLYIMHHRYTMTKNWYRIVINNNFSLACLNLEHKSHISHIT